MFECISKDEAKRRIDESPGDFVIWSNMTNLPEKIKKSTGKSVISAAKEVSYQDNDFFGTLLLKNYNQIQNLQSILFSQNNK